MRGLRETTLTLLQDLLTATSSAVLVLPYRLAGGRHNNTLQTLFDVEYQTFSQFLQSCSQSLLVKQNKPAGKCEISALIAGWTTAELLNNTEKDLCSRFFSKLVKSPSIGEKFKTVIKIFAASTVILDSRLLTEVFESFSDKTEEVILVTNEKNQSLSRYKVLTVQPLTVFVQVSKASKLARLEN